MCDSLHSATACDLLVNSGACFVIEGRRFSASGYEAAARSYARGFAEQGYPRGSLVLISLVRPSEVLSMTFGAWWAGLMVAFVGPADHRRRDRIALRIGAAVQVCDPAEIHDREHVVHRDVPAIQPRDLALACAPWASRCGPADPALLVPSMRSPHQAAMYLHEQLVAGAVAQRAHGRGGEARQLASVNSAAGCEALVRAAVSALAVSGRLDVGECLPDVAHDPGPA
jgi:hypothetical protein